MNVDIELVLYVLNEIKLISFELFTRWLIFQITKSFYI